MAYIYISSKKALTSYNDADIIERFRVMESEGTHMYIRSSMYINIRVDTALTYFL